MASPAVSKTLRSKMSAFISYLRESWRQHEADELS
jgi:hypothetical protein